MRQLSIILFFWLLLLIISMSFLFQGCDGSRDDVADIRIFADSVVNDVSHHPIGINIDYFMDDDNYLKPNRGIAEALRDMGVRYLRYPGGNKSDFYFFSQAPWEKSKPTLARTGKGAVGGRGKVLNEDHTDFAVDVMDFDEFMALCREIDAEPVVTVAADEYLKQYPEGSTWSDKETLLEHAVEWVRYANIKKKYGVKYWMIGNESWHKQNENSTAEIYAKDVVDFSIAMKEVDPSIFVIPNGNSVEFCDTVLAISKDHIDAFCISNYPIYEYKAGYATYRDTLQNLMHPVDRALSSIEKAGLKGQLKLIIAEYGPFDWGRYWPMTNDQGHNLCNFEMTGAQLLVPDIEFSCFWNTRWIDNDSVENSVYDALDKEGNFNANGLGLMIWGKYLGDQMLKTTSTIHVRSFASIVRDEQRMYIYLINKSNETEIASLKIEGSNVDQILMVKELVGQGSEDVEPVWQNYPGKLAEIDLSNIRLSRTSITVIEVKLKNI